MNEITWDSMGYKVIMKGNGYTPGPWHWVETEGKGFEVNDAGDDLTVASHMTQADARLIATAPELLEALGFAVNQYIYSVTKDPAFLRHGSDVCLVVALPSNYVWPVWVIEARAAIAKAKGGAA